MYFLKNYIMNILIVLLYIRKLLRGELWLLLVVLFIGGELSEVVIKDLLVHRVDIWGKLSSHIRVYGRSLP